MRMSPFAVPKELLPPLLPETRCDISRAKCAAVKVVFHPDHVLLVKVSPSHSGRSFRKDLAMVREREAMATSQVSVFVRLAWRAFFCVSSRVLMYSGMRGSLDHASCRCICRATMSSDLLLPVEVGR